ncbi:MAG: Lead, cadmium, zinc and mercury transporting ATPase [Myxococcales bacterium]|nr:Lead, cadmium, zinc and mercury transporting ATPase [Myxococcales bacterium]
MEAADRLVRIGRNRLPEEPPEPWYRKVVAQVSDFTVLALIGAAAIAAGLGLFAPTPAASFMERFGDSIAILAIVLVNAAMGLLQERKAERALHALRQMTAPNARVVRGGKPIDITSEEVVAGDVVLLEDGDRVVADLRIFEAHDLEMDESPLTGESMPVVKDPRAPLDRDTPLADRRTMAFMGTRVARGRARGVVANTGIYTELGAIAGMLARVEPEETPLEKDLERFGQRVVLGCIAVSALVFAAGFFLSHSPTRELFLVAVALAVAAIPEGLPAVTTIVLALGTTRMARRNALVRRLPAVETLGCAQVICTDKTGTLTQNAMTARKLWVAGVRYEIDGDPRRTDGAIRVAGGEVAASNIDLSTALDAAAHARGAHITKLEGERVEIQGDPTDGALQIMSRRAGVICAHHKILGEQPFTSARRMASVLAGGDQSIRAYVRGAPEVLLERATNILRDGLSEPLSAEDRDAIAGEAAKWAGRSMRVIGLAMREGLKVPLGPVAPSPEWETNLTFIGLVGIIDPPRPEVAAAIDEARKAGIRTVMITGDHPATARAIAEEIDLWREGDEIVTGAELDRLDQQNLEARIDRVRVVARATAEHKLRIVDALKARGLICAMTGDGVNDAPAVKAASIGVAMGKGGTDVTKEAAALVLADDNYATIVAAVEEGRAIYANIRKFIFFLLSSNAGAVIFVLTTSLLGWEQPLAPIQILWINLITNGLPALALGVDTRDPEQMTQPPRQPGGAILSGSEYLQILGVGLVMAATALIAFHHFMPEPRHASSPHELAHARAIVFAILSVGPLMHAFNCRSETRSLFQIGVFSNRALWGAVVTGIILQAVTVYVPPLRPVFKTAPLDGYDLVWVFGMSIVPFVGGELYKLVRRAR